MTVLGIDIGGSGIKGAPVDGHEQGSRPCARGAADLVQEVVDAADSPGAEPGLTVGEVHRRRMPDRRDRAGHERGRDPTDAPLAAGVIAATVAERLSRRP